MSKTHRLSMFMERDLKAALLRRARSERVPASQVVRQALRSYIEAQEERERRAALVRAAEEKALTAPQPTGS